MKTMDSTDDYRAALAYVERKLATQLWWLGENHSRDHAARKTWPTVRRDPLTPGYTLHSKGHHPC